jgi:ectoine hydroxylase-related dioxygenase (phytanoyl-CoA dioxygenase family)
MQVRMGTRTLSYPDGDLGELRDANALIGDASALRTRMADDGYLLFRGLIDRAKVLKAREATLDYMAERNALVPDEPVLEGVMPKGGRSVSLMGHKQITHHPAVLDVLEGEEVFGLFDALFGEASATLDYKWLRGVGNERFTGAHYDVVYVGRGSTRLNTIWIPFGDIPIEQGTLAMCVGSHSLSGFEKLRQTYGRMDVDRDRVEGWFTEDPLEITTRFGGRWLTSHFDAGDAIVFGMYTMHASTTNVTNRFRVSADVRFQPAADPMDERWIDKGNDGDASNAGSAGVERAPIAEARARWGV